jgi:transposase
MPYKFQTDKLIIQKEHDKRIKLTPEDKELIKHLYETTDTSQRKLASQFGVSRRLITFILDPEKQKANLQAREARGGSKQYYNKEIHAETMKAHRRHKKALYDASLLLAPDIETI